MIYIITEQYNITRCRVVYVSENYSAASRKFKKLTGRLPRWENSKVDCDYDSVDNKPIGIHRYRGR